MHELIKEYGESIAGAIVLISAAGLLLVYFLGGNGVMHELMTSYCGYLL